MEIKKNIANDEAVIALSGRLDTTTAPELEKVLTEIVPTINSLVLDFEELEYLSSAGLRVLLNTQKAISKQGKMIIRHVNDVIMDVFDMTGFSSILTIED
ncbi:MAG: STAS domain-containing protein [Bacilli bacterium]|nr:STAS domain-containing protein [Bacilli bacterium]